MAEIELNKEEWEAAMSFVLSAEDGDVEENPPARRVVVKHVPHGSKLRFVPTEDALVLEIPAGGGWARRVGKPESKNADLKEIPDNHPPAAGKSRTADESAPEPIPAGGGWATRVGKPESKNSDSKEIPNEHPPAKGPRTPIDWAAAADAAMAAINYGTDTSKGWSQGKALPKVGEPWGDNFPQGARTGYGDTPDDGKTTTSTVNKAPRSSLASEDAGDAKGPDGDESSLPDGSFCIHTADDVKNAVAKVQNAEQNNPHQANPHKAWYGDVKRHIVKRADSLGANHLIPADWQLSMG